MIKTAIFGTAIVLSAAAPTALFDAAAAPDSNAEQTVLTLPVADDVIAQFSHLEISHGADGFGLSITDTADIFLDLAFPGDLHIRIGF